MTELLSESVRKGWGEWEIRVLVIISLALQSFLIATGSRRKYFTRRWVRFLVWIAYLSADWVATVALSLLSIKHLQYRGVDYTDNPNYALTAFWAPFLLLHLGGPDTITAYSLEDNQLYWRHFLMLLVQVGIAFHVFIRAWNNELVNYLSIPMFVAGITKFGERSWVLRCSSFDFFRRSMFPCPDPGPDYEGCMNQYTLRTDEGYRVSLGKFVEEPTVGDHSYTVPRNFAIFDAASLQDAYAFFTTTKRLFADLILSVHDIVNSQSSFQNKNSCDEVFKIIEIELGFMYDVLYTKAILIYSRTGSVLRFVTLSCTISAFVALLLGDSKQGYSKVDIIITYVLLIGALCLEVYSVSLLLSSDWTLLWLSNHRNVAVNLFYKIVSILNRPSKINRWSNQIAQYNLIKVCLLKDKSARYRRVRFLMSVPVVSKLLERYLYRSRVQVPKEVKALILKQLKEKSRSATDFGSLKNFCTQRGKRVLEKHGEIFAKKLGWSVEDDTDFDESVLTWHIATDLCYHTDGNESENDNNKEKSKLISDYMLYVLVMRPLMLPNGIGQIRFQDTCADLVRSLEKRQNNNKVNEICDSLLEVSTNFLPSAVRGDRSKSVLFDACQLAKDLRSLERAKKWELVSEVWVEILCYAASQCRRSQHAQQLRQGGEFLTHVWLLMAHLGITDQFQISNGHARARLVIQ